MKFLKPGVLALLTALCYVAPNKATAQSSGWTMTPDKAHYQGHSDASPNAHAISAYDNCQAYGYECTPVGSASANSTTTWYLVWNGTGTSGAAVVTTTVSGSGSVNPDTASGASNCDGDLGGLHFTYLPAVPPTSKPFTHNFTVNTTFTETISASVTSIMNGNANASAYASVQ